jgi:hypothetical protein
VVNEYSFEGRVLQGGRGSSDTSLRRKGRDHISNNIIHKSLEWQRRYVFIIGYRNGGVLEEGGIVVRVSKLGVEIISLPRVCDHLLGRTSKVKEGRELKVGHDRARRGRRASLGLDVVCVWRRDGHPDRGLPKSSQLSRGRIRLAYHLPESSKMAIVVAWNRKEYPA